MEHCDCEDVPDILASLMGRLVDPAVRDLAWAIGSPGLLDEAYGPFHGRVMPDARCRAALARAADWLLELDAAPESLHAFVAQRPSRRLGRYFEALVEFWLGRARHLSLLQAHLAVRREKLTLGEFDFLVRDDAGELMHWETAVKYYLHAGADEAWDTFLGPSTVDRLDIKLTRVFSHQLTLKDRPEAAQAFPAADALVPYAFFKGYLFYPLAQFGQARVVTPGVSPRHPAGWWLRYGDQPLPQHTPGSRWQALPRLRWLAPARAQGDELLDAAQVHLEIERCLADRPEPVLLAELVPGGDAWHEVQRGFVVPPRWPETGEP